LIDGRIDLAVHSAKDMPTVLPQGLILAACPEREDPRDVFISRKARSLAELPQRAALGTASLRRQAIAKRARPDLRVMPLRGNVETRLRKLDASDVDATLLALAGLSRLGLTGHATKIMSAEEFLPAVGQGAIGIESRQNDTRVRDILARIDHADTSTAVAWNAPFAELDGSCKTPIGPCHGLRRRCLRFDRTARRWRAAHDIGGTAASRMQSPRRRSRPEPATRWSGLLRLAHDPGKRELISAQDHAQGQLIMRVVVTRPQADGERTARELRARGHEVLEAPLMKIETVAADLSGGWAGVIVTSANAPAAIAGNAACDNLIKLPLFAVGRRSADAAREAGFADVTSAGGDVRDLVRMLAALSVDAKASLLYLAGENRAADLVAELASGGIAAEMRIVYRAVTAPFPPVLIEALKAGEVDAVLHFSRRSADNYMAGAKRAGIAGPAMAVRHLCLSAQVAEPLVGAGRIAVATRPEEPALIELCRHHRVDYWRACAICVISCMRA
jgi:porphobilinogen deaminase